MPIVENRYFKRTQGAVDVNYYMSGQNLLDNWHFANPVNQRNQTTYGTVGTTPSVGIDRWWSQVGATTDQVNCYIEPANERITLAFTGTSGSSLFYQRIEFPSWMAGKTVTLSIEYITTSNDIMLAFYGGTWLIRNSIPASESQVEYSIHSETISIPADYLFNESNTFVGLNLVNQEASIRIKSIKLELGSISTLAVSAAPRFGEQLAICQRFLFVPTAGATGQVYLAHLICTNTSNTYGFIPTPVTMRKKPALALSIDPATFVCVGSNGSGGSANRIPTSVIIPNTPNLGGQSIPIQAVTDSLFAVGYNYLLYANVGLSGFIPPIFTAEL